MATETKAKRRRGSKAIVREYLEAIAAQDLDRAVATWKPGGKDTLHGIAELSAPDGIRGYFDGLFSAFGDFRMEIVEIVASGELAAARWRSQATFTGPGRFQGFAPTGAKVTFEGCDMFRVVDEQIVENHAYTNAMDVAQQLGLLPPTGSTAERAMTGAFNAKTAAAEAIRKLRER